MKLSDYQKLAQQTNISTDDDQTSLIIPLLGLAGETGSLLTEFKKHLRDQANYQIFEERIKEELGDILWYVANIAQKNDLDLGDIADLNLKKVLSKWRPPDIVETLPGLILPFDDQFPDTEKLPTDFIAKFTERTESESVVVDITVNDQTYGQPLTDNAYIDDGYRFHDVFHLAYMGVLGWSPISRRNLNLKRRSNAQIDEIEDGGRAGVIEEAISALVFQYAQCRSYLEGYDSIEYELIQMIQRMSSHLEVHQCSPSQWQTAILDGYEVWRQVRDNRGGIMRCVSRRLSYESVA